LASIEHHVLSQTSTFAQFVEPSAAVTWMLYACPNAATSQRLTRLNYGTPTYMRAPGESTGTFALESAMDELAYALAMDPVQLRLKNYAEKDPGDGRPFSSKSLRQCYQVAADKFGWSRRMPQPRSMRTPDGLLLGLGMATATYPTHRSPASALARLRADGTAYVLAGTQDIGTGTYTVMTQVAADALGLPPERVRFELGDTQMPRTPGSGGSQTAASTGSAVQAAGLAARARAIQLAIADPNSPLHGLNEADVDVQDGRMVSKTDAATGETYAALMARQNLPQIEAQTEARPGAAQRDYSMHSFGAVFTEVHVDPDLGQIRVARIVGAYGVGNRLNAMTARSQLLGGVIFGIGMALLEQTVADPRYGRIVNHDLAEYHVPVNADVPEIEILFVDEQDDHINPLGVKGIGEIGITGTAAAIANAVYHATGTRVRDLPITLDKVL
jgi:xanthine dehydrogenase YagR molybdenum-binding subunit